MSHEIPKEEPNELPEHLAFVEEVFTKKINNGGPEVVEEMIESIRAEAVFVEIAEKACEPNENDPDTWESFGKPYDEEKARQIKEQLKYVESLYEQIQNPDETE